MQAIGKGRKVAQVTLVVILILLLGSGVYADLRLESVYPTVGVIGQDLEAALTGTGFDEHTRVSMSLDVGNREAIIGSADTAGTAWGITVAGNYAYIADFGEGLHVIDISNPQKPLTIGSVDTPDLALDIIVAGDLAYVADRGSLQVIDISKPQEPLIIGSAVISGSAESVAVSGDKVYVAACLRAV